MKSLFRNRVIWLLIGNDMLDNMAIWVRNMAILFYVMEQTNGDPIAVSLITVAEYVPIFLFSMIGGTLADRWEPRRTMLLGGVLSAASVAVIGFAIMLGAWEAVFFATVVSAVVSQFSQPSSFVIIKRHLKDDEIAAATGLAQSIAALFLIGGPVLGTFVYSKLGMATSLFVITALFSLSTLLVAFLPKVQRQPDTSHRGLWSEMGEGVRFVFRDARLKTLLLLFALLGIGIGITQPLDIFIVTERLQLEKEHTQWFLLASGIGMLGGGVLAATVVSKTKERTNWVIVGGLAFLAVSLVVEAWSVWVPVTLLFRFLVGIAMAFMQAALSAMMIRMVDENYVGRINGTIMPIMTGTLLIGTGMAGPLMKSTSLLTAYFLAACIVMAAALIGTRLRSAGSPATPEGGPRQTAPSASGDTLA